MKRTSVVPNTADDLPYNKARAHLIATGWRGLAGWNRDAKMSKEQRAESVIDLYAKNGRILLLGASAGGGFELYYPSPTMAIAHVLTEIDAYGDTGRLPRGREVESDKARFRCNDCGHTFPESPSNITCPKCGGLNYSKAV